MYNEIEYLILARNLSKKDIAKILGIAYTTFTLKLKGATKFNIEEAFKLKELLQTTKELEELFKFTEKNDMPNYSTRHEINQ